MPDGHAAESLGDRARALVALAAQVALDGLFLLLWGVIQYAVTYGIARLHPVGVRYWEALALEILFAIATLSPVLVEIYRDITIMLLRANHSIQRERERLAEAEATGRAEAAPPDEQPEAVPQASPFLKRHG